MASNVAKTMRSLYGKTEDRYLELIRRFPLRPLRTDSDLDAAIAAIDSLVDRDRLTAPEQDYLYVLSDLVEDYEHVAVPIKPVSDLVLFRFLIESKQVTQARIAAETGIAESTISAILSGKRKLNRGQIGKLARYFHVSTAVFAD